MTLPRRLRADERGFALFAVCLTLLVLLTIGAASTLYTTVDLRATSHYDTGNRAFAAAEAGVLHALSTINESGVIDFENDVVDRWSSLYGTTSKAIPGLPSLTYQVAVATDAGDPGNRGQLVATGFAPLSARRSIIINLARGDFTGSPGAIYLAAENVSSQFTGNAFDVNGNDHNVFGDPVPAGPVKPGISTRNATASQSVINSLNNQQRDNVKGLGFSMSPLTPSVLPTGGPSVTDLDNIIDRVLSLPGVVTTSQKNFNGNSSFGSIAAPQITYMTNSNVTLNGNASGAGILVVDGSIKINGSLDFVGWIIVRGATIIDADLITTLLGNAMILGSLWTGHLDIKVGGNATVNYCDQCMRLVDNMAAGGGMVPRPMRVVSWQEVL